MQIKLEKREIFLILLLSAAITASALIPHVLQGKYDTINTQTWASTVSPWDTYTYAAWIEQARQSNFFFKNLFTSDPQSNTFFHPIFLILGIAGKEIGATSITMYQIGRTLSAFMLLITLYIFVAKLWEDRTIRLFGWLLSAIGSGVGLVIGPQSTDMWMTENNAYFGMYHTLLNSCSLALLLLLCLSWVNNLKKNSRQAGLRAGLYVITLAFIHLYYVPVALIVTGLYGAYQYKKTTSRYIILNYGYVVICALVSIWWQLHTLGGNTSLGIWAFFQSNVPAPSPIHYASGLGLLLILGGIGFSLTVSKKLTEVQIISIVLMFTSGFLLYNPLFTSLSRKFAEPIAPLLGIFGGVGLTWIAGAISERLPIRQLFTHVACLSISFSSTLSWIIFDSSYNSYTTNNQIISTEQVKALEWLKTNASADSVIIAGKTLGNIIPGSIGAQVFYGHYDQTIGSDQKLQVSRAALGSTVNYKDPLHRFLNQERIRYIIEDQEVRSWGGVKSVNRNYLNKVYKNNDVTIYKVSL